MQGNEALTKSDSSILYKEWAYQVVVWVNLDKVCCWHGTGYLRLELATDQSAMEKATDLAGSFLGNGIR